jgi:hypothetical protein
MSDEVMMDIQRTLGRIEQKIDSHVEAFDKHVEMDVLAYQAIGTLKTDVAKQKGAAKMLTMVGTALGILVGAIGSYLGSRH